MAFELSRPQPLMGAAAYKTYEMRAPLSTHFRPATCAEVDCPHYLEGWQVHLEALTEDLREAARTATYPHLGKEVRYRYREEHVAEGQTHLVFAKGQPCFRWRQHRARIDRPPLYIVRDGDFRGNPTGRGRQHTDADGWLDDFATHQQRIADEIQRG